MSSDESDDDHGGHSFLPLKSSGSGNTSTSSTTKPDVEAHEGLLPQMNGRMVDDEAMHIRMERIMYEPDERADDDTESVLTQDTDAQHEFMWI